MTRQVLMCEPVHYQVEHEINPWMRRSNPADRGLALRQWHGLRAVLEGIGVHVELVAQPPGVPDMTFAANAGVVVGGRFVASRFRHAERRAEEPLFRAWAAGAGYEVVEVVGTGPWEGEGDLLDAGGFAVAGYGFRTDAGALDGVETAVGMEVARLELADPRFYHLDTCLCPLGNGAALWYPEAFSPESQRVVRAQFEELVAVGEADAVRFACNAVVVGRTVVLNDGCPATVQALLVLGFEAIETPLGEFLKAGGSAKCLALTLDSFVRG